MPASEITQCNSLRPLVLGPGGGGDLAGGECPVALRARAGDRGAPGTRQQASASLGSHQMPASEITQCTSLRPLVLGPDRAGDLAGDECPFALLARVGDRGGVHEALSVRMLWVLEHLTPRP